MPDRPCPPPTPLVSWQRYLPDVQNVTFVQVGANRGPGSHEAIWPYATGCGWRGIAIEPVNATFNLLRTNYAPFPKVLPVHVAISDYEGQARLTLARSAFCPHGECNHLGQAVTILPGSVLGAASQRQLPCLNMSLLLQQSRSICQLGSSFGCYDNNRIWVHGGCRGVFDVGGRQVQCGTRGSDDTRRYECEVPLSMDILPSSNRRGASAPSETVRVLTLASIWRLLATHTGSHAAPDVLVVDVEGEEPRLLRHPLPIPPPHLVLYEDKHLSPAQRKLIESSLRRQGFRWLADIKHAARRGGVAHDGDQLWARSAAKSKQ